MTTNRKSNGKFAGSDEIETEDRGLSPVYNLRPRPYPNKDNPNSFGDTPLNVRNFVILFLVAVIMFMMRGWMSRQIKPLVTDLAESFDISVIKNVPERCGGRVSEDKKEEKVPSKAEDYISSEWPLTNDLAKLTREANTYVARLQYLRNNGIYPTLPLGILVENNSGSRANSVNSGLGQENANSGVNPGGLSQNLNHQNSSNPNPNNSSQNSVGGISTGASQG
jgi:hypothetical protein